MADNVILTAPTGTVACDEVSDGTLGTVKVQYVKLMDGTIDGTTKATVDANGLDVDVTRIGGQAPAFGSGANGATVLRVALATDSPGVEDRTSFVSGAITSAMTGTTSTSLLAAPAGGLRNYVTTIIVSNAHATVGTDVVIQDGSGGTTLLTIPAAAVYGGAAITLPTPLRQPTTATALYCANVTTGASTKVSAVGYTAA
jgi:hypothetical protein